MQQILPFLTSSRVWIVLALFVLYVISSYNGFVRLSNAIKNAFADVDVQMKLRFDLIENLINTVKWYASHERETLESLTNARTSFMNATSPEQKLTADTMLSGALKSLFAVAENYPDLKANQNFLHLQTELSDIENKIAAARRFFNSAVMEYNTAVQSFPSNIVARITGFATKEFFEISETERAVPKVEF
jgi:LemA protein